MAGPTVYSDCEGQKLFIAILFTLRVFVRNLLRGFWRCLSLCLSRGLTSKNSTHYLLFCLFFFFFACEVGFKMPSHLQWPSSIVSISASTTTIPPPLLGILPSWDGYLHYFGKGPEGRPVKDRCLLLHVLVHHIRSQLHAIGSSSHVSFYLTVSRSTFFLRSTHGCEFTNLFLSPCHLMQ